MKRSDRIAREEGGVAVFHSWMNVAGTCAAALALSLIWIGIAIYSVKRVGRALAGGRLGAGFFIALAVLVLLGAALLPLLRESVYLVIQKAKGRPAIRVDERGITDRSSRWAVGLIPWEDITRVSFRRVPVRGISRFFSGRDYYTGVFVRDPCTYIKRMSPRQQRAFSGREDRAREAAMLVPSTNPVRNEEFYESARIYCQKILGISRVEWWDERFIDDWQDRARIGGRRS